MHMWLVLILVNAFPFMLYALNVRVERSACIYMNSSQAASAVVGRKNIIAFLGHCNITRSISTRTHTVNIFQLAGNMVEVKCADRTFSLSKLTHRIHFF